MIEPARAAAAAAHEVRQSEQRMTPLYSICDVTPTQGSLDLRPDWIMITCILGQAIILDPCGFDSPGWHRMCQDVIDALAGELRREGAVGFRGLGLHRVIRIDVPLVQQ